MLFQMRQSAKKICRCKELRKNPTHSNNREKCKSRHRSTLKMDESYFPDHPKSNCGRRLGEKSWKDDEKWAFGLAQREWAFWFLSARKLGCSN